MKPWAAVAIVLGTLLVAAWIQGTFFPRTKETVTVIREDSTKIAAMRVELLDLKGRTEELTVAVTSKERESAAWRARTARLQKLVDEMSGHPDTAGIPPSSDITTPIAAIEQTVVWPGDSSASAAIDTVRAKYDIARDLWLALGIGYQERVFKFTSSTTTTTTTEAPFPLLQFAMAGTIVVLVLIILLGGK